jgi:hypothetical protein
VRFAFLKARQALMAGGHAQWFSLNYPLVKRAGLLRGPYHWLDPCQVQLPPTIDSVTAANWDNAALFPITTPDLLGFALQQANEFCDQILGDARLCMMRLSAALPWSSTRVRLRRSGNIERDLLRRSIARLAQNLARRVCGPIIALIGHAEAVLPLGQ